MSRRACRRRLERNAPYHSGMSADKGNSRPGVLRRSSISLAGMFLFLAIILFVPAGIGWRAIFATAGLDARYGWSAVPVWLLILGYVLFALGFALSTWVYAVNKFAEPSVRIQSERAHKVVDIGPCAIVRHPLYAVSVFLVVGMALALGSYWALLPVAAGAIVIIVRTVLEDRVLQNAGRVQGLRFAGSNLRIRATSCSTRRT